MVDRQELHNAYSLVWQYAVDRLGYDVFEGSDLDDVCMSDIKQIHICSRRGIENKLYALLHECGHALIRENWTKFQKEFPAHAACGRKPVPPKDAGSQTRKVIRVLHG